MRSVARIGTHPIHPILVAFPIACWTLGLAADLWAAYTDQLHYIGYYLTVAGCLSAVVAAIPGAMDLYIGVPKDHPARSTGIRHAVVNSLALVLFTASIFLRPEPAFMSYAAYGAAFAGVALLAFGGWLGGTMVYEHRVGVVE